MKCKLPLVLAVFISLNCFSQTSTKNIDIDFNFKLGANSSSLFVQNNFFGNDIDYGNKLNLRIGFETEAVLPFHNEKWSVYIEPTFQSFKGEEIVARTGIAFGDIVGIVIYKSIELPIGIKHYINLSKKSKLFIKAAYLIDFEFDSKIQIFASKTILKSENNLAFGIGYKFNDIYSIEIMHQTPRNITLDNENLSSKYQNNLLISFGFNIF